MKRIADEPISIILDKTATVTSAQGPWRGFFIMVFAIFASRKRLPWLLVTAVCGLTAWRYGLL